MKSHCEYTRYTPRCPCGVNTMPCTGVRQISRPPKRSADIRALSRGKGLSIAFNSSHLMGCPGDPLSLTGLCGDGTEADGVELPTPPPYHANPREWSAMLRSITRHAMAKIIDIPNFGTTKHFIQLGQNACNTNTAILIDAEQI
jgi:hypothetical protein